MYGRQYGERELTFEASGGLMHWSLVMQDKETDSYWAIMSGDSVAGEYQGTRLQELPVGDKVQWRDWLHRHPETKVLSVDGVEHVDNNPYDQYFQSEEGFRGSEASDQRLPTKESIYALQVAGQAYAATHSDSEGGSAFSLSAKGGKGQELFLYRPPGSEIFFSTVAYLAEAGFEQHEGQWLHRPSGARFDATSRRFLTATGEELPRAEGFDTFWFNWSESQPKTKLLRSGD